MYYVFNCFALSYFEILSVVLGLAVLFYIGFSNSLTLSFIMLSPRRSNRSTKGKAEPVYCPEPGEPAYPKKRSVALAALDRIEKDSGTSSSNMAPKKKKRKATPASQQLDKAQNKTKSGGNKKKRLHQNLTNP